MRATADDFTSRMFTTINDMMLDMLAAVAWKDFEIRRRRQVEGQKKAKLAGAYKGRPEDKKRNALIAEMLAKDMSWSKIQDATGCSWVTVATVARRGH
jgi:DNA invertase Pin-like site-specific DNA recombinase